MIRRQPNQANRFNGLVTGFSVRKTNEIKIVQKSLLQSFEIL